MTHPEAIVLVAANLEDVRVLRKSLAARTKLGRHHTEEGMTNVTAESGLLGNPFLIVIFATAMAAALGLFGRRSSHTRRVLPAPASDTTLLPYTQ